MYDSKQTPEAGYTFEKEYQEKMNELIKANADLDNLLVTAEIGALFIDNERYIRRVTPIMTKHTDLNLSDTGKNINEITFMKEYHAFLEDVEKCMQDKSVILRHIERKGFIWGVRICPYYTKSGNVEGVIIILFDITRMLASVKGEMKLLADNIPGAVAKICYDKGLIIEYASDALYKMLRISKEELRDEWNNRYDCFINARDWLKIQERIEQCVKTGEMMQMEYRVEVEDGTEEWRMMQAAVLVGGSKPVLQCVIIDITETKQAYLKLRQERKKLNIIAMMSGDMLFEYDVQKDYMTYTKQAEAIINPDEFGEHYVENIRKSGYFHPDDTDILDEFCEDLRNGKPKIHAELRKLYKDGQYHWIELEGVTIFNDKGMPEKVIGKTLNIDERKERERIFREKSEKDSLTGLLNHRVTRDRINERISQLKEHESAYLMVADIDNFKKVNDTNGHLFGDAVICTFADKLKTTFPEALKGRIGGDEFMMLAEGLGEAKLRELLAAMQEEFQGVYQEEGSELKISCSLGLVRCDGSNKDEAERMFQWADYALYQVKRNNKGSHLIVEALDGDVPSSGYLNLRGIDEDYSRKDTLIKSSDELVLFSLELLDNVSDVRNGLKMVSDRICKFFEFDDVLFIRQKESNLHQVLYHWSNRNKRQIRNSLLTESSTDWEYIDSHCDNQGMMVLRRSEMENMDGETMGSIVFVSVKGMGIPKGYVAFVDRDKDRDWEKEKDALYRLANIIFNRLQQMQEHEERKQEMDKQINYDALTKLPQYFRFMDLATQHCKENPGQKFYFVYSDFTNFQYINEVYGYSEGDKILQEFAKELQEKCKSGIYYTRVTSDHFVTMLSGDSVESAGAEFKELATGFCDRINSTYEHCNLCLISGISEWKEDGQAVSQAVDGANIARKSGKDVMETSITVYSEKMKSKNDEEKAVVARMSEAMEKQEFKAFIQPKISLATGKIIGGEALVRWIRADGSMVYPGQFIPVFEKNGFITKVDYRVLEQVLEYLQEALNKGEEVVPISVNFSRRHNEESAFTSKVAEYLEKYETPRGMLEAEVTENVFMMDLSALKENIERLHDLGVTISIDDFGSGYSSLNVLANVSADIIKLDGKFFDYTSDPKRNKEFIKSLIGMMKQMGFTTVMEGVETKEQMEFIKECGCDIVQGYYYAKPMPLSEFRIFLKEFNSQF
ncbi:MAG: EAL domain-containing protein [Lachnospiraceae bacterium]|nr:EAL domain-containing protein [Lachnospiraceae bacterium]